MNPRKGYTRCFIESRRCFHDGMAPVRGRGARKAYDVCAGSAGRDAGLDTDAATLIIHIVLSLSHVRCFVSGKKAIHDFGLGTGEQPDNKDLM